jgi:hypothetical protein
MSGEISIAASVILFTFLGKGGLNILCLTDPHKKHIGVRSGDRGGHAVVSLDHSSDQEIDRLRIIVRLHENVAVRYPGGTSRITRLLLIHFFLTHD